ncbi:glucans biosynthesis glucosyltransferase MdoH [Halomonas sp. DP8Y7-3]|uniref:glucans biosynthesis glucosyltransferase MdoH n=1 Tax=Halomonas sp. DP8Y7-3 TaxID=2859079 RepID=UPI001C961599|nr:glucans biosynthesis glucosyltransferase MdoH [Halomonas sp. DP8Y7-3]MBY5928399.1 glucans biosynthesis glucosyltransferase MdoH [Halomonas sp. DP8Y7-3]
MNEHTPEVPWPRWRRTLVGMAIAATTALGVWTMFKILYVEGITPLEMAILGLFAITFGWITMAFWSAVIGFVLHLTGRDPLSLKRRGPGPMRPAGSRSRTALVMPIHNEDVARVAAGLETTCMDLGELPEGIDVEAFVLSDSTDDAVVAEEKAAMAALQQRLEGHCRLHYRHRDSNAGRKAGNLGDFCTRWGSHYDYMLVVDADSLMSGTTVVELIDEMMANPRLGLLQTVPIPVRQQSLFGRCNQFAAALYSPMLAAGLSFWHATAANYFGHNAIIRVEAFTDACGLPELPGKPPLGGDILSHDFVEAALLRRAGWQVRMRTDLGGSYEEMPSHILDYAKRDRRWVQGNLQHLRLLNGHGLHVLSRLHFFFGALAYLSSLVWLAILVISTIDALIRALVPTNFFTASSQLFPDWPIAPPNLIIPLLIGTLGMLLMPKVLGLILGLMRDPEGYGGRPKLVLSMLVETLFAMLIAPLMMVFHSRFVIQVLTGRTVAWDPQSREGRALPWREAFRHTWLWSLIGAVWALVTWAYTPSFFLWLTPVWLGLVLAAPLVRWSSSLTIGRRLARAGLLLVPSETRPPRVVADLHIESQLPSSGAPAAPPSERPRDMPVQSFRRPHQSAEVHSDPGHPIDTPTPDRR